METLQIGAIMKLLNHSLKPRILWLLASFAALLLSWPMPGLYAQKSRDESQSARDGNTTDDGLKRRFETRGKAEFNDDYTDIKRVSEGGWVIIEEHRGRPVDALRSAGATRRDS